MTKEQMSEIEKLIAQVATRHEREVYNPNNHKTESNYNEVAAICADMTAAVIELIRERMPGKMPIEAYEHSELSRERAGAWDELRLRILKLLDTIK